MTRQDDLPELSPAALQRVRMAAKCLALVGNLAFIVLGLYWCHGGYTVAGFIAFAGALGWLAGVWPDSQEDSEKV